MDSAFLSIAFDPQLDELLLLPIDVSGVGVPDLQYFFEKEFREAANSWLSEEGLLATDNSAPQDLIDRASPRDVQKAVRALAEGVTEVGIAGQLVSNRRVFLLVKSRGVRRLGSELAAIGVSADAVTSTSVAIDPAGRATFAIRYIYAGRVASKSISGRVSDILSDQAPAQRIDPGTRLGQAVEDELIFAITEYLRNPDTELASAADVFGNGASLSSSR